MKDLLTNLVYPLIVGLITVLVDHWLDDHHDSKRK